MGTLALKHRRGYTHNRDVNYRQVERWRRSGLTCNKRTREPELSIVLSATSLHSANSRRFLCSIFKPAQIFPCSMAPVLLDVSGPSLAYIVLGGFVVVFSMVSLLVKEKLYINEVVLGTAFGVIIGPHCAGGFDPRSWGSQTQRITLEVMRIVLATGLFAIGVELPRAYMAKHAKGLLVMVVPTMAFGWVTVAAVIYGLFPRYDYISALVVAACLTPTDPIISAAIVGGKFAVKHVPVNLRHIISAESAANDGFAYPFLSISIYLTVDSSRRQAIGDWFLVGWLYQVILGTVLGAVLGLLFRHLMKFSYRKGFIDRESYVAQYLALALLTIGICSTIGSDDLLGAFAVLPSTGMAVSTTRPKKRSSRL